MIFKHVCTKGNKYLARIEYDDKGDKWATTTKAVHDWAKKNFNEGDEVDVEYNIKNGQYFVTRISAPGQSSKKSTTPEGEKSKGKYTCEDCGKELKDGKYEKCYTCNKKNPSKFKNTDTADAISRQNANHATSRALIALQGQVDVNNIFDITKRLHEMFLRLARGE